MIEPLDDVQVHIPEIENLFEGPPRLCYSHWQGALCDELVEELAEFATLVVYSSFLPQIFWTQNKSANLSTTQSRVVTFSEGSLVSFSAIDTAGNLGTTWCCIVRWVRYNGTNGHTGF